MQRPIVTKSSTQGVDFALNQLSANLAAHANATLSKAHGLQLIVLVPGSTDANGNDISKYYDNNGNVVGDYFLVIPYQGSLYYAPASDTTIPAQPSNTGLGQYGTEVAVPSPKSTALITDIGQAELDALNAVNNGALVPHVLKAIYEVHGTLTVQAVPGGYLDSVGNIIGDHVAIFSYNGSQFQIPCVAQLGGMRQPPKLNGNVVWALTGNTYCSVTMPSGTNFTQNVPGGVLTADATAIVTGTRPFTIHWQALDASGYVNLPPTVFAHVGSLWRIYYTGETSLALNIGDGYPGANNITLGDTLRVVITSAYGSVTSNELTLVLTDETGGWF